MRFISRRMATVLTTAALAGVTGFAQTPPAPQTPPAAASPAAVPCQSSIPGLSDAAALVNHIEDVVNQALGKSPAITTIMQKDASGKVATSGGTANKVGIDRDKLDEIRAELEQIKVILKR